MWWKLGVALLILWLLVLPAGALAGAWVHLLFAAGALGLLVHELLTHATTRRAAHGT